MIEPTGLRIIGEEVMQTVVGDVELVFEDNAIGVWHGIVVRVFPAVVLIITEAVDILAERLKLKGLVFVAAIRDCASHTLRCVEV